MTMATHPPVVMTVGGHDPSGGAGLTADVQTLGQLGCHPATVIAALTVQDTHSVYHYESVAGELVQRQCQVLLRDLPVRALKTGMLGSGDIVYAVAPLFREAALPLVVDPVLASGDGSALASDDLGQALLVALLPLARVTTPNTEEALRLTGAAETAVAAQRLLDTGCGSVLLTTTDAGTESDPEVVHYLYHRGQPVQEMRCRRLPGSYHGSGCTLASAIAAFLAHGASVADAVARAQAFTFASLASAYRLSDGQALPDRITAHAD